MSTTTVLVYYFVGAGLGFILGFAVAQIRIVDDSKPQGGEAG